MTHHPKAQFGRAAQGSTVVLVLAVLLGITAQLLVLSLITTRSLSDEAALTSQNQGVKEALNTAMLRFKADVQAYATANNNTISADFNQGGASDYDDVTFALTDPETGTLSAGNALVDAYVSATRGNYVQITARATYNGIDLAKTQWFRLGTVASGGGGGSVCSVPAPLQSVTPLVTDIVDVTGTFYVDQLQGRAFFGDNNAATARTFMYKPCSGLTTLFNGAPHSIFQDVTNDNIFILDRTNQRFYWLKADNTLVSVPAMGGADFLHSNVVADPNTGMAYAYRQATGAEGLYGFNPNTNTTTRLATFNWVVNACSQLVYNMLNPADGRLYMATQYLHEAGPCFKTSNNFYTYHPSTGLSTLKTGINIGYSNLVLNPNTGRIAFGISTDTNAAFWSWDSDTGFSTVRSSLFLLGSKNAAVFNIKTNKLYLAPADMRGMWDADLNTFTTFFIGSNNYPPQALVDLNDGMLFWGNRWYNPTTGLTTSVAMDFYSNTDAVSSGCHPLTCSLHRSVCYQHYWNDSSYYFHTFSNNRHGNSSLPTISGLYPGFYVTGTSGFSTSAAIKYYANGVLTSLTSKLPGRPGAFGNMVMNPYTGDLFVGTQTTKDFFYLPGTGLLEFTSATGTVTPYGHNNNMDYAHKGIFWAKQKAGLNTVYVYYHLDPNT